jgi:hypothetical protein
MFTLAVQAGRLLYRPHIPMLRENNVRTGFFEREQFESVLAHLPAEIQPVIRFAHITGCRIASEVLPLEWRRVDFSGRDSSGPRHDEESGRPGVFHDHRIAAAPGSATQGASAAEEGRTHLPARLLP